MATLAASTSASVKRPSLLISSPQQKLAPPRTQGLSFPCTRLRGTLFSFSSPKPVHAVSENSAVTSSPSGKRAENPIVVIDNYDSFTYNLCQYMGEAGCDFEVYRNDEITIEELKGWKSGWSAGNMGFGIVLQDIHGQWIEGAHGFLEWNIVWKLNFMRYYKGYGWRNINISFIWEYIRIVVRPQTP